MQHITQSYFDSPYGRMLLAATPTHLVGAWFEGQNHQPSPCWPTDERQPLLRHTQQQLSAYFDNPAFAFNVPLDLHQGTAFQQTIWQALRTIAPGQTTSYGALGAHMGRPTAARAVGGAVGRNPFSILLPCHRVVGAGGALTGYAGGLARKIALLQHESTR